MKLKSATSEATFPGKLLSFVLVLSVLIALALLVTASPSWAAARPFRPDRGFVLRKEVKGAQLTEERAYTVRLYTKRDKGSPYDNALLLAIRDEKSGETFSFKPAEVAGYEADFEIANFTSRGHAEIFLTMQSGGSGGYGFYYVVAFDGRAARFLYRSDSDPLPYRVSGSFRDGYRCFVKVDGTQWGEAIDVSTQKDALVETGVYDGSTGKRLKAIELDADPFSAMRPVDTNGDGIHELRGISAYSAVFHANRICAVAFTQRYEKGRWQLIDAKIAAWKELGQIR